MSSLLSSSINSALAASSTCPRIAVVVPCYNEAESLPQLAAALNDLRTVLAGHYRAEFLLVDDGSTDDTWRLMAEYFGGAADVRLIRHDRNQGIAAAIATGIAQTRSEIVASIDADCTYAPRQLTLLLPLLTDGVDVVVASPYHPRGRVAGVPPWRLAISKLASRLYRLVLRNKLHTYTSCFRVYRRASVAGLRLKSGGFVGIAELLCQVDQRGGRIVECPAVLTLRQTGHSKLRVVRTALAHLRLLARAAWSRCTFSSPPALLNQSTTVPQSTTPQSSAT
ncbi:MAG: glycosyltransferase family 2 protein [Pirellulaceae bacterium]|nr:glycosyltransferase family 2 protein [Pirellulaceae bacterium]